MKKTYITKMPDRAGAFLKAGEIISSAGANIVRVSYNKAVDTHTLFIDVSGSEKQLYNISCQLEALGYMSDDEMAANIILLEFRLRDTPGEVLPILRLIESFNFNISYINSQGNGCEYQNFKMGLHVSEPDKVKDFLDRVSKLCDVKIIDYDKSKKVLDNTVFYLSFANQIAAKMNLDRKNTNSLIADSNLIMQMLDENNEPAYKVFNRIVKFADLILKYKGSSFKTNITKRNLPDGFILHFIEPPCGSNTAILEVDSELLFIDSGFACYEGEMLLLLSSLFPNLKDMKKTLVITHPDIDHCGITDIFDDIYVSRKCYGNFRLEEKQKPGFREQNNKHAPYCRISKQLTNYTTPSTDVMTIIDREGINKESNPINPIGNFIFAGKRFDVYSGNGGHVEGEIVIVCEELKIVFSGDIVVNIAGFSPEQYEFNKIAPYLMTSVNMDTKKATVEREYLLNLFPENDYIYCCGHGSIMTKRSFMKTTYSSNIK